MHQKKIAVIGYGYLLPGPIKTDQQFWNFLCARKFVQESIEHRYGKGYAPLDGFGGSNKFASPYESLITEGDELAFDCKLFGLSPKEASLMDPQIKMMLTTTWRGLEHAGQDQLALRNSDTGVFVGTQVSSAAQWRPPYGANEFTIPGQSIAMIANRISYHFNWMGPSLCTMTACSASLTALNVAVNSLSNGECSMAIAGAVNYLGAASGSTGFNALGIVSPQGIGRSFDANGDGYVRAEGAFSFILKTLDDAERDGDYIHAIIRASRCNTAGAMDGTEGFSQGRYITAPTEHAQIALMQETCKQAGVGPAELDYLEAHATGTPVGDRVEGNAIGQVYSKDRRQPLRVASVKSNVGHMEAASFAAGLLKTLMMFKHRTFAPISASFQSPNPEIDFAAYNMKVQTDCEPFPHSPVLVGINSFGFGGANAHCILEEYCGGQPLHDSVNHNLRATTGETDNEEKKYIVPLSAKSESALLDYVATLRASLSVPKYNIETLAGNLSCRRTHYPVRAAVTAGSIVELQSCLDEFIDKPELVPVQKAADRSPRILMVFSGQGTQWSGCGKQLYASEAVFRRVVDVIDQHWFALSGESLKDIAFLAEKAVLDECQCAQPVVFMIQVALFELLKTWGVYADVVVGHSAGEVGAAYASGGLSLEEAICLVYQRSRAQQKTAGSGRMLAVNIELDCLKGFLAEQNFYPTSSHVFQSSTDSHSMVELACENSPESHVICAPEETLQPLIDSLDVQGIQNTLIPGNIAFHSHYMDGIREEVLTSLEFLNKPPIACKEEQFEIPFVSSVSAKIETKLDAEYWWSNIRQCVRFHPAISQIQSQFNPDLVIELSPHLVLRAPILQCYHHSNLEAIPYVPTLIRDQDSAQYFARCLGDLYKNNVTLDFAANFQQVQPISHLLPGHPMVKERMIDSLIDDRFFQQNGDFCGGPLVGRIVQDQTLKYETCMSARNYEWMTDHVVQNLAIVPAAAYLEMVFQALGGVATHVEEVEFLKPCPVNEDNIWLQTELTLDKHNKNRYRFTISSRQHEQQGQSSVVHCVGRGVIGTENSRSVTNDAVKNSPVLDDVAKSINLDSVYSLFGECIHENTASFYEKLQAVLGDHFEYGKQFQVIDKVFVNPENKHLLIQLTMNEKFWCGGRDLGYHLHPCILDGVLQTFLNYQLEVPDMPGIPREMRNFVFLQAPKNHRLVVLCEPPLNWKDQHHKGQLTQGVGEQPSGRVSVYDAVDGQLIAFLDQYISFHSNEKQSELARCQHYMDWQPKTVPCSQQLLTAVGRCLINDAEPAQKVPLLLEALRRYAHPVQGRDYFLHIVELGEHTSVEQLLINDCLDVLNYKRSQQEYCVVSSNQELLASAYEQFHANKTPLRFERVEFDCSSQVNLTDGLLRSAMAEIAVCRVPGSGKIPNCLEVLKRLLVPCGWLVLIDDDTIPLDLIPAEWAVLFHSNAQRLVVLSAPALGLISMTSVESKEQDNHWIQPDHRGYSDCWLSVVEASHYSAQRQIDISVGEELNNAEDYSRIDYFPAFDVDSDPLGLSRVSDFSRWMQRLVQARIHSRSLNKCKVTVFTRGAMYSVTDPGGASLWGAVRTFALEVAEAAQLDLRLVDIGEMSDLSCFAISELNDWREQELVIRNGEIFCHRLFSERQPYHMIESFGDRPAHYHLALDYPGQLAGLRFKASDYQPLAPRDVEIEIQAAALNFRDVMVMLGRLPLLSYEQSALGRKVGMEATGVIREVGSSVTAVSVGDRVAVMQGGCLANRVRCHESNALPVPLNTSAEQAAALASVYVTAYYALIHLSRMKKGQTLLVHSAMGGVGQAAIALARYCGVKVYATAGSDEKRQQLREMGVLDTFDSHSYDWHEQLMAVTAGVGVDIVLNSLAGHHIELCLESLKPGGWHCEIGKMDVYANSTLGLKVFRKNLRFVAIDVDRLMADDPELARELCLSCFDLIEKRLVPPLAVTCYAYSEYEAAFRCMMNGQHTGKLVLQPPADNDIHEIGKLKISDERSLFQENGSYLLSGCLGGFGLRLVAYMVAMGARHVLLLDRDEKRLRSVEWLRASTNIAALSPNVKIEIVHADVSVPGHVTRAIKTIEQLQWPALRGVFHLAGKLDDRLLENLDDDSFGSVFQPKAAGAWNLHQATKNKSLDYFVMLSSISSMFGNPSQGNYAAANAFLDSLAVLRHGMNLPALSYNMSAVSDAGMASRNPQVLRLMKAVGTPAISSIFALEVLDSALRKPQRAANVISVLPHRFPANAPSADYPRIGHLANNSDLFDDGDNSILSREVLVERLVSEVAHLVGHSEIGEHEPFSSYGLNSISVVELSAFIKTEFDQSTSALELMTSATCGSLADKILETTQAIGNSQAAADMDACNDCPELRVERNGLDVQTGQDQQLMIKAKRVPSIFQTRRQERQLPAPTMTRTDHSQGKISYLQSGTTTDKHDILPLNTVANKEPVLGVLDGRLPPACESDLQNLNSFVQKKIVCPALRAAKPAAQISKVLVTGATGFIGRILVHELCSTSADLTVHCLIRADNLDHAWQRLENAMRLAGLWQDGFRHKIVIHVGDISLKQLGLADEDYKTLSNTLDAVYHFAADVKLASSYEELRTANTRSMQNVLAFCLDYRKKSIFYASTMGIFPQYFCTFAKEFENEAITSQAMPNLATMKRVFPMNIIGYPWSKLVVEQALIAANRQGLPVGIFRIPQTAIAADTGYTQHSDIKICLINAMLETHSKPENISFQYTEPADTICQFICNISLNPARRHLIYHCSHNKAHTSVTGLEQLGFSLDECTYQSFKARCLSLGDQSALHGYWVLFDHFAQYWLSDQRNNQSIPISVATLHEDCTENIEWPGMLQCISRSLSWARQNPDHWPHPIPQASIDTNTDVSVAPEFSEAYRCLISALQSADAGITDSQKSAICFDLYRKKANVDNLREIRKRNPGIEKEQICKPVFILGMNRTGTTFLHRLMSQASHFRTPRLYEFIDVDAVSKEQLLTVDDHRRSFSQDLLSATGAISALEGIHSIYLDEAEEDFSPLENAFTSHSYSARFDIPGYDQWLESTSHTPAYKLHFQWMQYLNWQRNQAGFSKDERWLLKMPFHLFQLDALLNQYPDAVLIQTHRDPLELLPSWCHLVEKLRQLNADNIDRASLGRQQFECMKNMIGGAMEFRRTTTRKNQWIDVSYYDLVKDPLESVAAIYTSLGLNLDANTTMTLKQWLIQQQKERSLEKRHQYQLEDYALTQNDLSLGFSDYYTFLRQQDIISSQWSDNGCLLKSEREHAARNESRAMY